MANLHVKLPELVQRGVAKGCLNPLALFNFASSLRFVANM